MKAQFLHILFCFVAFYTAAQKPIVILEVEPKEAEVGEILTITVKSNVQGEIDIDFPSGFVHGYNVMNGMEQEIDYSTGKVVSFYYFSQTGAMPKSGTFKIGPAYVKKGNKVYRSNVVNITINKENTVSSGDELSSKQLRQPAFGVIEKSKSVIYEGEPLILNAKVYAQFNASHLENYQEYTMDGVLDKHDISNASRIMVEEEKIKRKTFYTFVHDKKVVFPTGTGTMTIDPFKLILRRGFESLPLTSSSTTVEVKPLPGNVPKDFIGAVGQFEISRELKTSEFKQGDVLTMIVEVSGHGNLQNILEPKLNLPRGFVIYGDPIVKEDFVYGSRGAEGKISYEYNIQITRYGKLTLPETVISYFDPTKEKYIQVASGMDVLNVEKNEQFKATLSDTSTIASTPTEVTVSPLRRDEGNKLTPNILYNSPIFWLGVSSPMLLAFILGLWWKKKEEKSIVGEQKQVRHKTQMEIQLLFIEAEHALKQGDFNNYYNFIEKGIQRSMALYLKHDDTLVLSKAEIFSMLKEQKIDTYKIQALQEVYTACEYARYGMGQSSEDHEKVVVSAKEVIQSIVRA